MATTISSASSPSWILQRPISSLMETSSASSSSSSSSWLISFNRHNTKNSTKSSLQSPPLLHVPHGPPSIFAPKESSPSSPSSSSSFVKLKPREWNLLQKATSMALDSLETNLVLHEKRPSLPKTADPRVQIAENFASVPEQQPRHILLVNGKIPNCIQGVYVRNGANLLYAMHMPRKIQETRVA